MKKHLLILSALTLAGCAGHAAVSADGSSPVLSPPGDSSMTTLYTVLAWIGSNSAALLVGYICRDVIGNLVAAAVAGSARLIVKPKA